MAGIESKAESQGGQDSQIISETVADEFGISWTPGFQNCVKEIFNLLEQDENFSEITFTPEVYNSKKSELKKMVTKLSRMSEALADQNVHMLEENKKLKQELSSKESEVTERFQKQFDEQEARNLELQEKASSGLAVIANRNEQLTELNTKFEILKAFHESEEEQWNADMESLKTELDEKCEKVDELNQKHGDAVSCVHSLQMKMVELDVCLRS